MNRRAFLASGAAFGTAATAGCLGTVGFGDQNPNVVLGEPDRTADVASEDLPYPAWGQQVPDVTLPAPLADRSISLRDIAHPYLSTFFFANCMTTCPVLLSALREVQVHSVQEGYADAVGFYPITFDPARDDAAALRAELDQFNVDTSAGNWQFLRPEDEARAEAVVTDEFGIVFQRQEMDDGPDMFVHLGLILLVNGDGYVERAYRGQQPDEGQLIDDLRRVRGA
ncbi:SCO family protein [Salinigranum salinum]|uniref:SCO family protein n=1 Tax=Salinigranum salinum TaxID=1364937 RepID=UPI001260AF6A|nr:SCO family protein [Salinigranum salinum]